MVKRILLVGAAAIALSGCGAGENNGTTAPVGSNSGNHAGHSDMNHSVSGELPPSLKEAANPKFEVGSQALLIADHMEGMEAAEATIAGAYDTIVYAVSYTPTTGGKPVENHKWVIQEEIQDAADRPYEPGEKVVLEADHMKGMKGAVATIDSAEAGTVYAVDYTPAAGGEPVKNHKWVTESELSPMP